MNKLLMIPALATILLTSSFSGCKKDDNSNSVSSQVAALTQTVQTGKWKVTLYNDNGTDETNHYTGYEFQFNTGGTVVVTKTGNTTVNGTWTDGNDDSTIKFVLNFGTTNPFLELNDDWHVTQQSSTLIKLENESGGGSGTDYLTFEKI